MPRTILKTHNQNLIECLAGEVRKEWCLIHGDCVDVIRQIPSASVGFCIYPPPFSNLFTYSDSECDMGNNEDDDQFFEHYQFLIPEIMRIMQPGRLCAVHCSDIPLTKWKDGLIALNDLPAKISLAHTDRGWALHTKVTIWKDPVVEMQRTKALGLLHMQLKKDSVRSRMGMADYLYVFRAPGINAEPVPHSDGWRPNYLEEWVSPPPDHFPVEKWQEWASPVWMDIRQTNTLNTQNAKDQRDEKHVAPLQLDLIERALTLWSNPGNIVFSPFAGIGSEGYQALKQKRKFVGVELKQKYFEIALKNLSNADKASGGFF
jgi:DNA modification methylase